MICSKCGAECPDLGSKRGGKHPVSATMVDKPHRRCPGEPNKPLRPKHEPIAVARRGRWRA